MRIRRIVELALRLALVAVMLGVLVLSQGLAAPRTASAAMLEEAVQQSSATVYIVQRGDTLSSIARKFNTTVNRLMQLNGLTNPNLIRVGQRLLVSAAGSGSEGDPIRIQFPAGGIAATVAGSVTFPNRLCYVAGALANQQLTVQITSPGNLANFLVRAANPSVNGGVPLKRLENEDRTWTGTLPVNGDYLVCVATPSGTVAYTLTITILPLSATPTPGAASIRVRFPAGGTSATLTGQVAASQRVCYVLGAGAGQQMTVQIISPGNAANFLVSAVDISAIGGFPLKRLENEDRVWTGVLPATTDYLVCVATATGSVNYSLTISISPLSNAQSLIRIQFPAGGTSATLTGRVSEANGPCYVLRALANQLMTVQVTSAGNMASFSLAGTDGIPLKRLAVGGPSFSGRLTATQDYTICMGVLDSGMVVDYTLFVAVTN